MIALLERFYDPSLGRIAYDSQSLTDLCPRKYRSHISLVQQEPVLYQGSICDNIAMGAGGEVSDEQIEEAAKQSNIHTFVASLPEVRTFSYTFMSSDKNLTQHRVTQRFAAPVVPHSPEVNVNVSP
jgi:ABC-type multidrug transport system fused ATPase/permease subunit